MKHVVITGGLGFIGHHLAYKYLESNCQVTIIDNLLSQYRNGKLIKYRIESLNPLANRCTYLQHDCCEEINLMSRLKENKPDVIINLASYANQAAVAVHPADATRSMPSNALIIAQIAKRFNCQLIHISSSMVYGNFETCHVDETSVLKPTNLYGILKLHSEELVRHILPSTVIIRPSAVYGPGDSADRVLAKWIKAALRDETINVHGPSNLLDFTYVKDLVDGIVKIESKQLEGKTFNVTRGQAKSLGEAAVLIKDYTNSLSSINYLDTDKDMPTRGALDITQASIYSNYSPKMNLDEGLKVYINWMKNHFDLYE